MAEGPVSVSYPAVMRDYLRGDVPGAITPVKVTSWHAEAVTLQEALARLGLGAVVIPQKADKSPLVSFVGPKDDCKWPAAGALRQSEWSRAGGLGLLIYEDVVVLDFDELDNKQERVDFFVSCVPLIESAPREVTGGGVHVFNLRRRRSSRTPSFRPRPEPLILTSCHHSDRQPYLPRKHTPHLLRLYLLPITPRSPYLPHD